MIHPLQLRYAPVQDAAPDAWFLPGDSAAAWLEQLARSGLAVMDTRLFVIPQSLENRAPAGLLVLPSRTDAISETPRAFRAGWLESGCSCRWMRRCFLPSPKVN